MHATEVLILQHPLEQHHAKNSARLLHLSLSHSRLIVGEAFDESSLRAALHAPKYTVLLYPRAAPPLGLTPALDPSRLADVDHLRLVVLDATWRKSRKMLHQSLLLQGLPRLSLDDVPVSRYVIRKAHKPGQLSTLEATCAALAQLENKAEEFLPLLAAFNGFVAQQLGYRQDVR
jgi:DTW domain-containing protein YfiP